MARRSYTAEFKREAVRLAAKELGIHPNVLMAWHEKFKSGKWEEKSGADLKSVQA